ncbi:D-glycero-alpha-D-manno-heptose-1,7-bisphosphate 7-phosphatase [Streptomyces litchfieldiae]|uniref:D,D-heptose 1,7-bisphosphate phosphatase n=1 Tax=Streptomyces litchfieldiae TaxID=3075543 RepID=A0ABU2MXW3_9ACTN|nr:HAD family hydrolase [Streptomyces sp. DSM 44938]MDT0346360.1 HAD family hydrolase [Streptomyces sp. DSM 44938]
MTKAPIFTFPEPRADRPWLLPSAGPGAPAARRAGPGPDAVLFDRDGTLIEDVPYNADPALVRPLPRVGAALDLLRERGIPLGVVSNQSGAARGRFGPDGVAAVRRRVEELLGPFGVWAICPHGPGQGCHCRKPAPGLIIAACAQLGVAPDRVAVVGDIGADLAAARAAGARGVLVPTPVTRRAEIVAAEEWAPDLLTAVRHLLGPARSGGRSGEERSP